MAAVSAALSAVVFATAGAASSPKGAPGGGLIKKAALGQLKPAKMRVTTPTGRTVTKTMPFMSTASIVAAQEVLGVGAAEERLEGADAAGSGDIGLDAAGGQNATGSGPAHSLGCGGRSRGAKGNVRVNQDCTFRRQAEEEIVYNPADPNNLVAGQNDSRVGFNQCGVDFSTNNGKNWGDMLPPFRQHVNSPEDAAPNTIADGPGTLHTYDADSDPTLAADNAGNTYFSCVAFDIFSNASMLYVTRSPAGAEGSFYYNVPLAGRRFIVAEDNNPGIFHDKQFITADYFQTSPNRGNVYVTWTVFKFDPRCGPQPNPDMEERYCSSPIYGSMSTDHARTWSAPELISGTSDAFCVLGNFFNPEEPANACNFDQGSDPIVLPNGDLEVVFNNGNTPSVNGQQLGVHCHPTGDSAAGTAHLNCVEPSKVGNDVAEGEPQCDFGRGPEECIPGGFIRTNDFPRILTQNSGNNHLYAVWQDYRNDEYDIQMSISTNGGLTWREAGTVNPDRGLDHYFAAVEQTPKLDDHIGVSYYRTARVPNENQPSSNTFTGGAIFAPCGPGGAVPPGAELCAGVKQQDSDYVLAGGTAAELPYDFKVVAPPFAPPDGIQAGFNGDYSGLAINKGDDAHPIWSDTRNADPFTPTNGVVHDEDVFTDNVGLPNGRGRPSVGQIGKS